MARKSGSRKGKAGFSFGATSGDGDGEELDWHQKIMKQAREKMKAAEKANHVAEIVANSTYPTAATTAYTQYPPTYDSYSNAPGKSTYNYNGWAQNVRAQRVYGQNAYHQNTYYAQDNYAQNNYAQNTYYDQNTYYNTGNTQQMAYNDPYANYGTGYGYPPGYNAQQYAQPQAYQAPHIHNPFAAPAPQGATHGANADFDPDYQAQIAQWQSTYAPADQQERGKKNGKYDGASAAPFGQRGAAGAEGGDAKGKGVTTDPSVTVVRKGGGETWEDKSLLEWDPTKFRIMVGNLAGEVTDDLLSKAFANYDVSKARVVRDKRTTKSKGYGFVEFNNSDLGFKAAREMNNKYIGSHPVTIKRSTTNVAPVVKKDNKNKGKNDKRNKKDEKKDQLRANTNAGIEKKPSSKAPPGLKLLG